MTHPHSHTGLFGAISAGSLWQFLIGLRNHAPSWELVPPLLIGLVGLFGVVNTCLNDRHRRAVERIRLDAELARAAEEAAARRAQMKLPYLGKDKFNCQN